MSEVTAIKLSPVMQKFILHWGEMGTRWGINRTVAQVYALLYLSPDPLNAEDITTTLSVARSNVSTSLKELQTWGIIKVVHVLGDRRDHFTATKDAWETFQKILDERKRREVDPTLELLQSCVAQLDGGDSRDKYVRQHLLDLLDFFATMVSLYEEVRRLPSDRLRQIVRLRGKIRKLLALGRSD
jgi:DNA-binding transcriptional regulator GbsR (MarR family)